jgi:hypothetical protein
MHLMTVGGSSATSPLDPRLRRGAAVGRIRPLRDDTLQPHPADMLEHGRAVAGQMLNELDRPPLGPADQLCQPPLSLDRRQVAKVVALMLDQVEGVQHRLATPASAPQRMEVRRSSNNRDHRAKGRHQRPIDSIFSDMLCL